MAHVSRDGGHALTKIKEEDLISILEGMLAINSNMINLKILGSLE